MRIAALTLREGDLETLVSLTRSSTVAAGLAQRVRMVLPFSEWGTVFPDPRLVAAIVDRVTFNAHILETGTQSYRLRTSTTTTRRKRIARKD